MFRLLNHLMITEGRNVRLGANWNVPHTPSGRSRDGLLQNFQNGSPTFAKRSYEHWRAVVKTCYVSNALGGAVLIFSSPSKHVFYLGIRLDAPVTKTASFEFHFVLICAC
jgi:hypothetical protein